MGKCTVFYDELRFDTRSEELHAYVFIRCEGDCMHTLYGWHRKVFAKGTTPKQVMDNLYDGGEDFATWEREAPRPVNTPVIFQPWEQVPVKVEHLQQWAVTFAHLNTMHTREFAEQAGAYLSAVPKWDEACPHCHAMAMLRNAQQPAKG